MATGADQCQDGCGIVMPLCLIAVDVDDKALADEMVARFPAFGLTVACKTKKGMHFYFTRTAGCTLMDGARQAGEALAIDIKTQTRTGTGGVISVPPSPCKEWLREFGECEALPIPAEFVAYYEAAIRASGGAVVVAPPPAQRATVTVGDRDREGRLRDGEGGLQLRTLKLDDDIAGFDPAADIDPQRPDPTGDPWRKVDPRRLDLALDDKRSLAIHEPQADHATDDADHDKHQPKSTADHGIPPPMVSRGLAPRSPVHLACPDRRRTLLVNAL